MSSEFESDWFDQLKARINEFNQKDLQAIARAREERDKLQKSRDKENDQATLKT